MINNNEIRSAYRKYGFEEKDANTEGVLVFTLRTGHFHNADIVIANNVDDKEREKVFSAFRDAGYACKTRCYESIEDVKSSLFKGFFSVKNTKDRLSREYDLFTKSIVSAYSDDATYSYINTSYEINCKKGESNAVDEIIGRLDKSIPTLFLIEAAAGFGKTCTAYELLHKALVACPDKVPLFSELSRNRQAKIFRYVLLDEIDRTFPQLSSSLVQEEIVNGNIITILDGFDELLHRSEKSEGYDNAEPMLETIGQLLNKHAKVILTTRRTSIFDGDEFHEWMDNHEDEFSVVRIKLDEPCINDWLPKSRLNNLLSTNYPIKSLSNPVLLSYLRCISEGDFERILREPSKITDRYFSSMLNREMERQNLRLDESQQYDILKSIAKDMMELNYTAESREYLLAFIVENYSEVLEKSRSSYSADERPTKDELANKLTSHALLDRDRNEGSVVRFVNEFVFGNFCADVIVEDSDNEWIGDVRFMAPAVLAYSSKNKTVRDELYNALVFSLEFVTPTEKVDLIIKLLRALDVDIYGVTIARLSIDGVNVATKKHIKDSVFVKCVFKDVTIDLSNIVNTTFVECSFYNVNIINKGEARTYYTLDCDYDDAETKDVMENEVDSKEDDAQTADECEVYLLEKFCPIGRANAYKHRPLSILFSSDNKFSHKEINKTIRKLKQREIFSSADQASFVELNFEKMSDIRNILGRS